MSGGPVGILRRCHCLSINAGAEGATREFDATQPSFNPDQSTCEAVSTAAALQHFGGREIKFRSTASLHLPTSYADHYPPKVHVDGRRPLQSTQPSTCHPPAWPPTPIAIYSLCTQSQQEPPPAEVGPLPNTLRLQSNNLHLSCSSLHNPAPPFSLCSLCIRMPASVLSNHLALQPGVAHTSWWLRTERPSSSCPAPGRRCRRSSVD